MEPYESIYAGSFIFTLGYLTRAAGVVLSQQAVALLCQNKGDHLIGDLVHSWQGRNFIIEFKRNEGAVREEFRKPHKRVLLSRLSSPEAHVLRRLSRRAHFIGYGVNDDKTAGLAFMPYSDAVDHFQQTTIGLGMDRFYGVIIHPHAGLSGDEFKTYVGEMVRLSGTARAGSGGRGLEVSSLVLNYDPATGKMKFLVVDLIRMRELRLERCGLDESLEQAR